MATTGVIPLLAAAVLLGSLQAMEANAFAGADVVTLPAGTYDLTRAVALFAADTEADGDLDVTESLDLVGAGATTTGAVIGYGYLQYPLHADPPVIVQLQREDGTCWEARYTTPLVSTDTRFRARSDP